MNQNSTKKASAGQDITIQSHSLARFLDRLPVGLYNIVLEKGSKFDEWHVVITEEDVLIRDWTITR